MKKNTATLVLLLIAALTLGVYALGLGNGLVFDDDRLTDGTVYEHYGSLLLLQQRLLSYGSFVWVNALAPDQLPLQRLVNLVMHLGTAWGIHALFGRLLARLNGPDQRALTPEQQAGLVVGTAFFALAPVAVYAVGYLIQRSIVLATLLGVWACYAFVRALMDRRPRWLALAAVLYLLAALSKEHAVLLAALTVPLYVFVVRPPWQRAAAVAGAAALAVLAAAAVLARIYPDLIGQVFDDTSRQLVAQLERQRPGAAAQIYPLSLLNQAALFFYYGFLWLVPVVGWMSIDMRPPFPLSLGSLPHLLGALGYIALLAASVWAVLRRTDVWGFIGLCLLFPLLLFWTEFATVWVQDPMVLYRSYLWAIPIPGLIAVALAASGFSTRVLYGAAIAAALVLGGLSAERLLSMKTPLTVWTDAIEKTDLRGPANAVGRYRAFINRGAQYLDRFSADLALADFRNAQALGEPTGGAVFNMGVAQQVLKKHADALRTFAQAEAAGYRDGPLYYHRGESQLALGQHAQAHEAYTQALGLKLDPAVAVQARLHRAETSIRLGRFADAGADFDVLTRLEPANLRHQTGLGMARLGQRDGAGALAVFEQLLGKPQDAKQTALAHYGRAMAHALLKQPAEAREHMAEAVKLDPQNAMYRQLQQTWVKEVTLPKDGR